MSDGPLAPKAGLHHTLVINPKEATAFSTDPPPGLLYAKVKGVTGSDRQALLNPRPPARTNAVKHQDDPYGKLMADLDAILHAVELRCGQDDEAKNWLMVLHAEGLWPVPFDRLQRLIDLKLVRMVGTPDDKDVRVIVPSRELCLYWIDQWNKRMRQYTPPSVPVIYTDDAVVYPAITDKSQVLHEGDRPA